MPAQNRVGGDEAVATQCAGQPPHEGGEHGPVRPVQARPRVGAAQDGDLVPEQEKLDVLGGGRAHDSRTNPSTCRNIKYSNRNDTHAIMPNQHSPLVNGPGPTSGTPQGCRDGRARSAHRGQAPHALLQAGWST
jgi:hypothetical protein